MKNTLKLFSIIFLTGCQTLGLINEDPRAPTALNGDYDEFASQAWSREVVTPIITYQFFGDNIQPSKFFDISGSGVYLVRDEAVEMINIDSGDLMTSLNIENEKVMSGVTVAYNTYLYSDIEGKLYLHNLNNGDLKWKNDLKDLVISKALITPLHVYVQTSSDVLYAFDFQTGEIAWSKNAQAPLLSIRGTSNPVFYEGLIFATFSNGRLAAIRAEDGIQLWEKPISRIKGSTELEKLMDADSPAIAFDEFVYAANYNGSLTRFNIRGGEKLFSVDLSTTKPIKQFKDMILAVNVDDEIIAFDALNGTEKWRNPSFKFRKISELIFIGNNIYFGDLEGYLHKLNAQTGETIGQQATELEEIVQIETRSGRLIAQDSSGSLSAFDLN